MPALRVPDSNRPSFLKYAVFAIAAFVFLGGGVAYLGQSIRSPGAVLIATLVAGVLNVVVLFMLVQSLIEEWIGAAEVVEE